MAKFTLDFGQTWDLLTQEELDQSLKASEDARLRALVAGVKASETYISTSQIGAGQTSYTTTGQPPQAPTAGYIWAVMSIGADLSASSGLNIYKNGGGLPTAAGQGIGKPLAHLAASTCQGINFSKGQLWLRPGEQLAFFPSSGNILSVYLCCIEVPAERIGEMLL